MLLIDWACLAAAFAWAKTGNKIAASMAMMAITTSSSIKVNADFFIGMSPSLDVMLKLEQRVQEEKLDFELVLQRFA